MPERRLHPRISACLEMNICGEQSLVSGTTIDISLGGASMRAARGFPEGETVLVVLSGQPGDALFLAEVLESSAIDAGSTTKTRVMFRNVSTKRRDLLTQMITSAAAA